MKGLSTSMLLFAILIVGCQTVPRPFDLSIEQAKAKALESGPAGEIVDVIGDPGPYRFVAKMGTSIAVKKTPTIERIQRFTYAGHSLNYPSATTEYFHTISLFKTASGGGLMIGTKYLIDQSRFFKLPDPSTTKRHWLTALPVVTQ